MNPTIDHDPNRTADLSTDDPDRTSDHIANGPAVAAPPLLLNRYCLGRELARGGMGVVYRARDEVFDRDVAVKLMQHPNAAAADRFRTEARITARLQHPAIPAVFDMGELPTGEPFLAMKLIEGRTLADILKDANPGPLLPAFEQICQAVAYAHSRGVIHRDLKPANIMIGTFGEVQVMDWGLAKLLAIAGQKPAAEGSGNEPGDTNDAGSTDEGTPDTDGTRAGSVLGTPAYMAPEQARGEVDRLDERTDVFGLGAILCTVLTGKPPWAAATGAASWELAAKGKLATVCERLDGSGADPDLIVLAKSCLSADRGDRPANAVAVARRVADLRAAADERAKRAEVEKAEVQVRAAEAAKRRRLRTGAGIALVAVFGAGAGLAGWQAYRATAAERAVRTQLGLTEAAEAAAKSEAENAIAAQRHAETQSGIATRAMRRANGAMDSMTSQATGETLETQTVLRPEQKRFLTDAVRYYSEAANETHPDAPSQAQRAEAADRVGRIHYRLGNPADGLAAFAVAESIYRSLAGSKDGEPRLLAHAAISDENCGICCTALGRADDAERHYRRSIATARELTDRHPSVPEYAAVLANAHTNLGAHFALKGRSEDSDREYAAARALWEALFARGPDQAVHRPSYARTLNNYAVLLREARRLPEAERSARDGVAQREAIFRGGNSGPKVREDLAASLTNYGIVLSDLRRASDAETAFRRAARIREALCAEYPAVPEYSSQLAVSLTNLGSVLLQLNRPAEAAVEIRSGAASLDRLVAAYPDAIRYRVELGSCLRNCAIIAGQNDGAAEAIVWYTKAIAAIKVLPGIVDRKDTKALLLLRDCYVERGVFCGTAFRHAEVVENMDLALACDDGTAAVKIQFLRGMSQMQLPQPKPGREVAPRPRPVR